MPWLLTTWRRKDSGYQQPRPWPNSPGICLARLQKGRQGETKCITMVYILWEQSDIGPLLKWLSQCTKMFINTNCRHPGVENLSTNAVSPQHINFHGLTNLENHHNKFVSLSLFPGMIVYYKDLYRSLPSHILSGNFLLFNENLEWYIPVKHRTPRKICGLILCMGSANEIRCCIVTSSLIGWAHTQDDPWYAHGLWCYGKTLWRHQMETFSALLALCAGIHWSPVNSRTRASDAKLWCFLWSAPE